MTKRLKVQKEKKPRRIIKVRPEKADKGEDSKGNISKII
jgi:hypothetical protein